MKSRRHARYLSSLLDQAEFLRIHASIEVSERLVDAADETLEWLADHQSLGFPWPDPTIDGIRYWPIRGFPNHRIMYRSAAEGIEGLLVFHSAQDPTQLFPSKD